MSFFDESENNVNNSHDVADFIKWFIIKLRMNGSETMVDDMFGLSEPVPRASLNQYIYSALVSTNCIETSIRSLTTCPEMLMIHVLRTGPSGRKIDIDDTIVDVPEVVEREGCTYYIFSIIIHMGNDDHGHYVIMVHDKSGWLYKCISMMTLL